MKRYRIWACLCLWACCAPAFAQLKTPSLSPKLEAKHQVGLTHITITYSRPSMRGREIFGADALVPYGQAWRAGANAATKIELDQDIFLDEKLVEAGVYTILVTPQADKWTINWYPYTKTNWQYYLKETPVFTLSSPVQTRKELQ
ncbi:MAG: DUF2911 domain-containing protein, partial [Bacteroidota bacterium]